MKKTVYKIIPMAKLPRMRSQTFSYSSQEPLQSGDLVKIPLGSRVADGVVLEQDENPSTDFALKDINTVSAPAYLHPNQMQLLAWMSEYYNVSLGKVAKLFLTGFSVLKRKNTSSSAGTLAKKTETLPESTQPQLTPEQTLAFNEVFATIKNKTHKTFLLHGITGSGKTEIYLRLAKKVHENQAQSAILIPEIALTPQITERFKERFGDDVLLYHSRLTPKQKREVIRALHEKPTALVVGPRSVLFLPFQNLGLIVIDEEHDGSFVQYDQNPKYDARNVAEKYAELWNIPLIMGTATPRIETFYRAKQGEIELITLTKRISRSSEDIPLPEIEIVDLVAELKAHNRSPFSEKLYLEVRKALDANEQVFLFLNRRGFASSILCVACAHVMKCKNCSTPLILHGFNLLCHHCGHKEKLPSLCPSCNKPTLKKQGLGTERIELETKKLFSKARVVRMDRDTIRTREDYNTTYQKIKNHEVDVVIGTQMIAQGLDIPQVQLVGVIQTDNALNLPDFRSEENVFQLISQVAGRAGRRKKQGKVIVQTFFPNHTVFKSLKDHSYEEFFNREIEERKRFHNPPFAHIAVLTFSHKSNGQAEKEAMKLHNTLSSHKLEILGPSPTFIPRKRSLWRWQLIIRAKSLQEIPFDTIPDTWDINLDPQSLLAS